MKTCPDCHRRFVDAQEACPLDWAQLGPADRVPPPTGIGRVLGSYRLICLLAEGGMGNIYIGAHTRLNRYAAIKLLKPELQNRKDAITRFFEEARTINRIKHPNIVESIDLVEDLVDGAYCVLELLHGPSLKRRLVDGRLQVDSALRIAAQIADALHAVHSLDIVHRDLKPDNLILINGEKDKVKLIDFGVAQISHNTDGVPVGTAAYMAPEQAVGGRVDGRADVYALGVILFEMITGIHPFPSTTDHEYLLRHADDTPKAPSKILLDQKLPKELDAIVLRCLEKRPEDRFPSAAALAAELRSITVKPKSRAGMFATIGLLAGAGVGAALILPDMLKQEDPIAREPVAAPAPPLEPVPPPEPPKVEEAPPPAQPETVTLKFVSEPAGANVYRKGETVALGTTPFETKLVRAGKSTPVTFKLDGFEDMEVDASLEQSENISVTLDKLPPPPKAGDTVTARKKPASSTGGKVVKKPLQREGVMDPFATKN